MFGDFKTDERFVRYWNTPGNDEQPIPKRFLSALDRAIEDGLIRFNEYHNWYEQTPGRGEEIFGNRGFCSCPECNNPVPDGYLA